MLSLLRILLSDFRPEAPVLLAEQLWGVAPLLALIGKFA